VVRPGGGAYAGPLTREVKGALLHERTADAQSAIYFPSSGATELLSHAVFRQDRPDICGACSPSRILLLVVEGAPMAFSRRRGLNSRWLPWLVAFPPAQRQASCTRGIGLGLYLLYGHGRRQGNRRCAGAGRAGLAWPLDQALFFGIGGPICSDGGRALKARFWLGTGLIPPLLLHGPHSRALLAGSDRRAGVQMPADPVRAPYFLGADQRWGRCQMLGFATWGHSLQRASRRL